MCPAWTPVARGPGTGTTDGCESSRGCWDSNLSPLQEQQALLTTQPSPQPLSMCFRFMSSFLLKHLERRAAILPAFLTEGTVHQFFPQSGHSYKCKHSNERLLWLGSSLNVHVGNLVPTVAVCGGVGPTVRHLPQEGCVLKLGLMPVIQEHRNVSLDSWVLLWVMPLALCCMLQQKGSKQWMPINPGHLGLWNGKSKTKQEQQKKKPSQFPFFTNS